MGERKQTPYVGRFSNIIGISGTESDANIFWHDEETLVIGLVNVQSTSNQHTIS